MKVEDEYTDVLQNIESSIVTVYRERREVTDSSVIRSLEAVIEYYIAEQRGRSPKIPRLTKEENEIYSRIREVCEYRMGRTKIDIEIDILDNEVILRCLKRILKSAMMWNKEGGLRGYLTFVSKHL